MSQFGFPFVSISAVLRGNQGFYTSKCTFKKMNKNIEHYGWWAVRWITWSLNGCSFTHFYRAWVRKWYFRCVLWRKPLPQTPQRCGLSPVWLLKCFLRCPLWVKRLSQKEQQKGFSPVWILMCIFRSPFRLHAFPHTWQWCSFTPEWPAMCSLRAVLLLHCLPHTWQHFEPLWEFRCTLRLSVDSRVRPHTAQRTSASFEWMRKAWFVRWWLEEKDLSHKWQR